MKTVIWAVLAALLAGAAGFYVGVTYQKNQSQAGIAGRVGGQNGAGQGGGGRASGNGQRGTSRMGGSVTTGTILAQDATSITVKTSDGGSKKLFLSVQTRYSQQQQLTAADLKVGDQVLVTGQDASGGFDARTVTVVPPGSEFRFGPAAGPQPGF
jgi:hypothetical protein